MSAPFTPQEVARALGGEVTAKGVSFAPPGHSAKDRSGRVLFGQQFSQGFWVEPMSPADDWRSLREYVMGRLGIDSDQLSREPSPVERMAARARRMAAEREHADDAAKRTQRAIEIWEKAVDPRGTIVEQYLASRMLHLPREGVTGAAIRFHGRCPWRNAEGVTERRPAMIGLMRDTLTGEPKSVHRTLLSDDGRKLDRRMLGPSGGTAIMFDAPGPDLVAGEGIESALSARQIGFGPTWALGSAGEIERLRVVPGVERLFILEEIGDSGASAKAVKACGHRWTRAGREVASILPKTGNDMNDSLMEASR